MVTLTYAVVLYPDPDASGSYVAEVPDLPGLATEGETIDSALVNAHEAIARYLEELQARGEQPPVPGSHGPVVLDTVLVNVA